MENSIGVILREARVAKQLSIEQVAKGTKIHPSVIRKIESDDFKSLPAVYVKSFLKIYSEYLGLEKADIMRRFESSEGPRVEKITPVVSVDKTKGYGKEVVLMACRRVVSFLTVLGRALKRMDFKPLLILLIAVFLVSGVIKLIKNSGKSAKKKPQAVVAVSPKAESKKNLPAAKAEKQADILLTIKSKSNTWLQVKSDGKVLFQGVLAKGRAEGWAAKEKFELWIGDAGAVELEFNGKILEKIGRPGQTLKHVELTRSGVSVQK